MKWTDKECKLLIELYPHKTNGYIAEIMDRKVIAIKNKARVMKLKKSYISRCEWTTKCNEQLKRLYPHHSTVDVAKMMNRTLRSIYSQAYLLSLKKSKEYMDKCQKENGLMLQRSGKASRFSKGHVPANKGKSMDPELKKKISHSFFKKGHIPQNKREIGSSRITKDGYIEIKVEDPSRWELLHRFMWKVWMGPIPKGYRIVFKDGNRQNCNIDNLDIISDEKNMMNNNIQRYPEELRNAMIATGRLKAKIKRKINNQ